MHSEHMRTVTVQKGESLHDALKKLNIAPERPCGGRGTCGLCSVTVAGFGEVKSCQFRLPGTYQVAIKGNAQFDVLGTAARDEAEAALARRAKTPLIAVDIGTTTVAWKLFYRGSICSGGFVNPQRMFGADVMSRIRACGDGHLQEMRQALKDMLSEELAAAIAQAGCGADGKAQIAIAANTTMLHILNGWDCAGLGRFPFTPESLAMRTGGCRFGTFTELPGISAFIGADITSGMYALALSERKTLALFVDLGTNGEMVIGTGNRFLAASAAAGPAFEASGLALSCHASGMLKLLHKLLREQVMDENGLLREDFFHTGYPTPEGTLTQELIRELQMAKAAIRAGIEILLREYADEGTPDAVYLAGGMGCYIDPADAVATGLVPKELAGRIVSVGNTALAGAVRFLSEPEAAGEILAGLAEQTEELRLAEHPDFEELYLRYMSFPQRGE